MFTTKMEKNQILQSWHAIGGNEIWFQEWPGAYFIMEFIPADKFINTSNNN